MKKALALVLALVLALSMGVVAFADVLGGLVVLGPSQNATSDVIDVPVVPAVDEKTVLYTTDKGTYYIALDNKDYQNVTLTANNDITAELVDYDPEKMNVTGLDINWGVTRKGVVIEEGLTYKAAVENAANYNEKGNDLYDEKEEKVTYYGVKLLSNVNIIKVTVAPNYTASYRTSTLTIKATLEKQPVSATLKVVTDVTIFEYEQVKWTADNTAYGAYLDLNDESLGYSDWGTDENGYGADYDSTALRNQNEASVVSTTAFRAIAGKNLVLKCKDGVSVAISNVANGQKGVNFKHTVGELDTDRDGKLDAIQVNFLGNQVIASEYTVTIGTNYTWYTLREAFGVKVEEDDIITYYLLKDGKVVKEYVVDYMTADYTEAVALTYTGSNSALGCYELVMEVPAVEGGEENPNTGAESVVGVVAALAVVSVATAAAVSLKK